MKQVEQPKVFDDRPETPLLNKLSNPDSAPSQSTQGWNIFQDSGTRIWSKNHFKTANGRHRLQANDEASRRVLDRGQDRSLTRTRTNAATRGRNLFLPRARWPTLRCCIACGRWSTIRTPGAARPPQWTSIAVMIRSARSRAFLKKSPRQRIGKRRSHSGSTRWQCCWNHCLLVPGRPESPC